MAVNKERLQLGLDALRSGKFVQGTGKLKRLTSAGYEYEYCCLGVLCEVAIGNGLELTVSEPQASGAVAFDEETGFLPPAVMEWYGFEHHNPNINNDPGSCPCFIDDCPDGLRATAANDTLHLTFSQIADGFEKTYLKEENE